MSPIGPLRSYAGSLLAAVCVLGVPLLRAGEGPERLPHMNDPVPLVTNPSFFPILPWDPLHGWREEIERDNALEGIAECNFTMAGFVKPGDLSACEQLGLKALVFGTSGRGPLSRKEWATLSDEEIRVFVRTMVADAGDSDAILGYYLVDEPGASLFPKLAVGVAAVREHAPGKLAYINLFPGYATIGAPDTSQLQAESYAEYLERFVAEVRPQILSYDNYRVQYSNDLQDPARAAQYYLDLLEVRRVALQHNLPFWNIVSSNQIRPFTTIPSPENLHFQAYTTLAAGGRGVTWYTYNARGYGYAPIDREGNRTMTWQYLQMVNRQLKTLGPLMNRLRSTGVYFTDPPPAPSLPTLPGELVEAAESDTPLMIGEFVSHTGGPFAMAVNLSLERSVRIRLALANADSLGHVVSAEDGSMLPMEEGNAYWLTAGQGILISLSPRSAAQITP